MRDHVADFRGYKGRLPGIRLSVDLEDGREVHALINLIISKMLTQSAAGNSQG
jgi:hypothetical protein